ncbi:MAG: ABC transporter permease [Thermodesulfobacteriota bacterium]
MNRMKHPGSRASGIPGNRLFKNWAAVPSMGIGLVIALSFSSVVLLLMGSSPLPVYWHLLKGSLGSWQKLIQVINSWVPLTLCATGLLYTFRIDMWNIGIEGQIMIGAIFSTWVLRGQWSNHTPSGQLFLSLLAAMAGGGFWALITGFLKTRGGVNEIFAGLGMNFIAQGLVIWLIFGPWKRAGMASMSGTEILPPHLWLPTMTPYRFSPIGVGLAVACFIFSAVLLHKTHAGLAIKAVGKNLRAANTLGIPTERYLLLAMLLAGCCGGIAGNFLITGVYHRLLPAVSCNYGYLSLLVVMLSDYRILPTILIAFFFASINVGSIQLPILFHMDSAFSGVLQGLIVISALCLNGWRSKPDTYKEKGRLHDSS